MTEIESSLGKTSYGTGKEPQGGRVLTVEDRSESPEGGSFGHNPIYRAGSMQRQGEAGGYQRANPRGRMDEDELKEFEERRADAVRRQKSISPEAKSRIEFLLNLGRIVDSVTVEEVEFTFQSLTGDEQNEVFESLADFDQMSALRMQFEVRFHTLARALTHIQGKPFSAVIESDNIDDKLNIIKGMDESLSDHLYKWYHENIAKLGQEKYAVNTKEDVEEVAEAIKKS